VPKPVLICLAVEDDLSEQLLRTILHQTGRDVVIAAVYGRQGSGYLKKNIRAFNKSAAGFLYAVLTDLDGGECAPALISDWFGCPIADYRTRCHHNMIFRIAVRESEAWVMADRERFARFLGISTTAIPQDLDAVDDPKRLLIELTKRSRSRDLRDDIVPRPGDTRSVGPDYSGRLAYFLSSDWRGEAAQQHSRSLQKARTAIQRVCAAAQA
jgi:hypothetical protein